MISSSSAMREYSLPCSFLASSYSAFSDRSPKERASFSCSATSSARVVFRYSSSSLYASRLSCVSLISFALFANPSYSVSSAFEPYSTLYYKLSTNAMSSDSTIFCPIFCRSARLSHSFHRFLKLRIGFRRQEEKVLCLLIGQLHLNVRRNADIRKAFALGRKVFLNRQIDR